ncbi:rhodanese-like domain-containing protein [Halobacteriovorax sp. JY17]|uniref:rhodanese-like domain-containing protein n=1 Tax=Halobacteriovorax sp. JY17 TaxID=2014617 RepID=UPI000C3721EC|nr:rhodanese-like domain-containing protein [Halobacteriovorax sp. JY17]PIK13836.1 MAG: hypothetical protein CES88_12680 [Halobacteriovorax sp. JY17]
MMDLKMFQMLEFMNNRLSNIEKNISRIDEKLEFSLSLQRNHLIRIKNGEFIDDSNILMGKPYNDLSPQRAFEIYQNQNLDFLVLDVSKPDFKSRKNLEGSVRIPLEELQTRYAEINSKTTPILVFSEQGLRSIQACELLIKKGFFNLNNVSGGHRFWPTVSEQESSI